MSIVIKVIRKLFDRTGNTLTTDSDNSNAYVKMSYSGEEYQNVTVMTLKNAISKVTPNVQPGAIRIFIMVHNTNTFEFEPKELYDDATLVSLNIDANTKLYYAIDAVAPKDDDAAPGDDAPATVVAYLDDDSDAFTTIYNTDTIEIPDDLICLQNSINRLFDKLKTFSGITVKSLKNAMYSTLKGSFFQKRRMSAVFYSERIDTLKTQTDYFVRIFNHQLDNSEIIDANRAIVIRYVCDFVDNVEISIDAQGTNLIVTLKPHDRKGKHSSINTALYCPAMLLFRKFLGNIKKHTFKGSIHLSDNKTIHYNYSFKILEVDRDSSFAKRITDCHEAVSTGEGGSKSRRTHRRKHARKTHHKHARKTRHKRARRSRTARKHKKYSRRR